MRLRLVVLSTILFAGFTAICAQTVVITPRKTVYRRPKPLYDFKRTFTIKRAIARAATPALSRKITAAISPEKVLEVNVREELGEIQWLEETDYKVLYNQDGLLSIELWMTGTGAYPDSTIRRVVIDSKTGNVLTIPSVFSNLAGLASMIRKAQIKEVASATEEMKSDPDAQPDQLFSETNFTTSDLNEFSISKDGITFYYDYGFPHVLEALQPDGQFHFTWNELKPFIKNDGLLARFVR